MVKSYLWALLVRVYCCVFCNISQFLREVVPYFPGDVVLSEGSHGWDCKEEKYCFATQI